MVNRNNIRAYRKRAGRRVGRGRIAGKRNSPPRETRMLFWISPTRVRDFLCILNSLYRRILGHLVTETVTMTTILRL
jgi:ribosomal protein L19E